MIFDSLPPLLELFQVDHLRLVRVHQALGLTLQSGDLASDSMALLLLAR
jgi:hypothetical protein